MKNRKIKILHIGNVANYGYNIGKILQTPNIESHTINWDYYHFASRPEWEEADFDTAAIGNHFFPKIPPSSTTGFVLPEWYAHGPRNLASLYLIARNEGKSLRARIIRGLMDRHLRRLGNPEARRRDTDWRLTDLADAFAMELLGQGPRGQLLRAAGAALREAWRAARAAHRASAAAPAPSSETPPPPARALPRLAAISEPEVPDNASEFDRLVAGLVAEYRAAYPGRTFDPMLLYQFAGHLPLLKRLFAGYDLVVGYANDGIWPLVAGKPYVAYEFGTIRNIPFTDDWQGRLGFLAYRRASRTVVTNADNQHAARALGLDHFFLPHVINESGVPTDAEISAFRAALKARHGGDFFVFHPPRQHWNAQRDTNWDKGNDHLFRGFASFVREAAPEARCIAVAWGDSLEHSRRLVAELGIERNVAWIDPQPHVRMMRYLAACDVVADQFSLRTFGGIPPKAFYLGRPVVTAFDPALHTWCYAHMPPIAEARTADGIAAQLTRLYSDPAWRAEVGAAGSAWYRAHNSNARVREILEAELGPLLRLSGLD